MGLYEDLLLEDGQIRLLRVQLLPEGPESTPKCTLSTHSLKGVIGPPDFLALSYTWGPPHYNIQELRKNPSSATHRVNCNGTITDVSENLFDFLCHCAMPKYQSLRGYIWIDALCINQHDTPERSRQVNLMGDIYKAASRVVVWLGVEDQSTKPAFDLMNQVLALPPKDQWKLHPRDVQEQHTNSVLDMDSWRALGCFYQRTWFNRAWIIQEVVFAKTVIVLCGSRSILWDQLTAISHFLATSNWARFLKDVTRSESPNSTLGLWHDAPTRFAAAKDTWESSRPDKFLFALIRARSSQCQDPRDKVYSQLGLGEVDIFPDYYKTEAEVYITTAKYILEHSKSLMLLTCVEGEDFQAIENLPSWVPDWSVTSALGLRITGYVHYNAPGDDYNGPDTGTRQRSVYMEGHAHILSIQATKLDDIVETCETKWGLRHSLHSSTFWEMISRLDLSNFGGSAIWRTLMTNRASNPPEKKIQYPAASERLEPSFRAWILWRYALASEDLTTFPVPSPSSFDTVYPTQTEILDTRRKCLAETDFLTSLAHQASFFDLHYTHAMRQRPFRTQRGYFGTGTQCLLKGDSVWVAPGCRVPLIFRRLKGSDRYRLVGGAYVHGFMNGEVLRNKGLAFETVSLE